MGYVVEKDDHAQRDRVRADRAYEIPEVPAHAGGIGVDPARHSVDAQDVLEREGDVHSEEEEPEVDLSQGFVEHAAGDLRVPVVEAAEQAEDRPAEEDVVNVGDDE